jgi:hypothetical protein
LARVDEDLLRLLVVLELFNEALSFALKFRQRRIKLRGVQQVQVNETLTIRSQLAKQIVILCKGNPGKVNLQKPAYVVW